MVAGNKTTFSSCSYRIAGGSPRVYCLRLPISLELDRLRDENPLGLAPARQQHSNYLGDCCCCCVVCLRRASARSLQIILALVGNNNGVAIIGVQLKNNGRTRIKTERTENKQESESCYFYAKEVKVFDPKPITPLVVRGFDSGRIRKQGGGRKKNTAKDATLRADLEELREPKGDPESLLTWTSKEVAQAEGSPHQPGAYDW